MMRSCGKLDGFSSNKDIEVPEQGLKHILRIILVIGCYCLLKENGN